MSFLGFLSVVELNGAEFFSGICLACVSYLTRCYNYSPGPGTVKDLLDSFFSAVGITKAIIFINNKP